MAKGKAVVLTVEPKGIFKEGTADVAMEAGICIQVKPATAFIGGRAVYRPYTGADGGKTLLCISYNSGLLGDTRADTVAAGSRVFGYCPLPGDEMNVLVQASAGALAVGDKLILDSGTGKFLKTTGTPASEPFEVLEASADVAADRYVFVQATGH